MNIVKLDRYANGDCWRMVSETVCGTGQLNIQQKQRRGLECVNGTKKHCKNNRKLKTLAELDMLISIVCSY